MKTLLSFFLFSFIFLYAEDFSHKLHVDNKYPYVKEAVILTLELNQSNKDVVLLFNFRLKKSKNYSFQRLSMQENDAYHNLAIKYTYLIYPLKEGKIRIDFALIKKVTTDASIAYSFSGDRDNVKTLETKDSTIPLAPLFLDVKALPKGTELVGDFALSYTVAKHKAQAYEPLPFSVNLKGKGYPPVLSSLLVKEGDFQSFSETPLVQAHTSIKGTESLIKYSMAFSHYQSFVLEEIALKAFNPQTQKSYTLSVPEQAFSIDSQNKETLLDNIDSPKSLSIDTEWIETLLGYIIVFLAGYATAYAVKLKKGSSVQKGKNPFRSKIESATSTKALLQTLISLNHPKFDILINTIEKALISREKTSLGKLKKEALGLDRKVKV